jgi:hypothetical protein
MKRTHQFIEGSNRYEADTILMHQGFCQVDTGQDFSGYGNWIHLGEKKAVTFAEGDLYQIEFEEDAEVKTWLEGLIDLKHIDCGISNRERNLASAAELGISHLAA